MSIEIKVPEFPESVTEAKVDRWKKKPGDFVQPDDVLVEIETDKVVLEVPAPVAGRLVSIKKDKGAIIHDPKEVLGILEEGAVTVDASGSVADEPKKAPLASEVVSATVEEPRGLARLFSGPASRRAEKANQSVKENKVSATWETASKPTQTPTNKVERVAMSRLRAKIAERLVSVQQEAAILTTFNEVNLQAVMDIRARYKDKFEKQHGVRLGFMSFFTKAAVEALKQFPVINASVEGADILYHHYYDIGIAVSTDRGLVVPIIRNADQLGFADIEKSITAYGNKAREGKISLDELTGGTFTITNGGIFGSLLSTPILNPPQSAILGMHKIEERPVVEGGQVVIRPMMYLALSYDHRIIDGKESVQFLAAIKNLLEDPTRLLLDL